MSHTPTDQANAVDKTTRTVSGAAMDRHIPKQSQTIKKSLIVLSVVVLVAVGLYTLLNVNTGRTLKVDRSRIIISTVTSGIFEDFIPIRARVVPAKTLYLDAIEGGRVEHILVEDGTSLKAGDLIVEMSNAALQLNALGNEARVAEQLNNMRSIELSLEQNRLKHKKDLADIHYQINMLSRKLTRESSLVKANSLSQSQFEDTRDTLDWYQQQLQLTLESQESDSRMQGEQLKFLRKTSTRLERNLAISQQNLDNMNVRAPVAGKLSGFNVEIGQSIAKGERLGQIDTPDDFKLSAHIDEFYLSRVDIGQQAQFDNYRLQVKKIYPQVQNGQFEVDFEFIDQQPDNIRRGQTIQIKLTLGDATEALLIPNGAFYQDTGGNWLFVVDQQGSEAIKRSVRLGRRNSRYIEVLDGLDVGEQVVTSPYSSYQDLERLKLSE